MHWGAVLDGLLLDSVNILTRPGRWGWYFRFTDLDLDILDTHLPEVIEFETIFQDCKVCGCILKGTRPLPGARAT